MGLGDTINITMTVSEIVVGGSAVTATLNTGDAVVLTAADNGTTLVGTYTVPANRAKDDLSVSTVALDTDANQAVVDLYGKSMTSFTIPSNKNLGDLAQIVIDTAGPAAAVQTVKYLDSVTQGVVQVEQITDPVLPTIATGDKFKVTLNGVDIETAASASGSESTLADIAAMLNTANAALGAGGVAGTFAAVTDDLTFTYTAVGPQSGTIGKLFWYDADKGGGAAYDDGTGAGATSTPGTARGTIELTGTGFTDISTDPAADVKAYFDWTKFVWDLDGDDTNAGVTFAESDILSAKVTSGVKIKVVLTDAKTAALETTAGFAADGIGATNRADEIDVLSGFIRDAAGNVAIVGSGNTNPAPNVSVAPTYANVRNPTIVQIDTISADKAYGPW